MAARSKPIRSFEIIDAHWAQEVRSFEAAALRSFSFLDNDYGFDRRVFERREFEDGRDAHVVVPYCGAVVSVEVRFHLSESRVGAAIYELENGRKPERVSFYGDVGNVRYGRAIDVDTFISMSSGGTLPQRLPEASRTKPRIGTIRAAELRSTMLTTNMDGVVAELADRVKTWCMPILKGDTSMFATVQQLHRKIHWPER